MNKLISVIVVLLLIILIAYTQLTIFVIQPIGAVPEGKTLIITRLNKTKFIDSADAICDRELGNVNLICRIGAMASVLNNSTVIMRLPYSSTLYRLSTGGVTYER